MRYQFMFSLNGISSVPNHQTPYSLFRSIVVCMFNDHKQHENECNHIDIEGYLLFEDCPSKYDTNLCS